MVKFRIIRYKHTMFQRLFHHRMAPILYGNPTDVRAGDYRFDIPVSDSCTGKTGQTVQCRDGSGCFLHSRNFRADLCLNILINLKFQFLRLFPCAEGFDFKLLQLRCNISFRVDQCLLSYIIIRNRQFIGMRNFKIIAKNIIKSYLQFGNAC